MKRYVTAWVNDKKGTVIVGSSYRAARRGLATLFPALKPSEVEWGYYSDHAELARLTGGRSLPARGGWYAL